MGEDRESGEITNLSHEVDYFRFSLALLVEQFVEAFAEILVDKLVAIRRFVVVVVAFWLRQAVGGRRKSMKL